MWVTLKWGPIKNTKIAELQSAHISRRYTQTWGWTGCMRVSTNFVGFSFYHQFCLKLINATSPRTINEWVHYFKCFPNNIVALESSAKCNMSNAISFSHMSIGLNVTKLRPNWAWDSVSKAMYTKIHEYKNAKMQP